MNSNNAAPINVDQLLVNVKKRNAEKQAEQQQNKVCSANVVQLRGELEKSQAQIRQLQAQLQSIQNTPASPTENPTPAYVGCFRDDASRTMQWVNNNQYIAHEGCRDIAKSMGRRFFATQHMQADGKAACFVSDDINQIKRLGPADNCAKRDSMVVGSVWSNAVYDLKKPLSSESFVPMRPVEISVGDNEANHQHPAVQPWNNHQQPSIAHEGCRGLARSMGRRYFATQYSHADGNAQCFVGDDIEQIKKLGWTEENYGQSANVRQRNSGGWENAVYDI